MTLGEFKSLLRRAHKRGTALDDDLVPAIRRAGKFIEQNYTLQYMRRRFELTLEAGENEVELPGVKVKAILTPIIWTNSLGSDGRYNKATKVALTDIDAPHTKYTTSSVPSGYYLDGTSTLVFVPNYSGLEDLTGVGMLAQFSDFPIEDDEEHWLFEHGEGALLAQSMLELGLISRDDRTYAMFQQHIQSHLTVMLNADAEAAYAGQDINL